MIASQLTVGMDSYQKLYYREILIKILHINRTVISSVVEN